MVHVKLTEAIVNSAVESQSVIVDCCMWLMLAASLSVTSAALQNQTTACRTSGKRFIHTLSTHIEKPIHLQNKTFTYLLQSHLNFPL